MAESSESIDYPVLVVGGGLVGLTAGLLLAQHGVRCLVVERLQTVSPLPRAAHFHLRTLEILRSAGLEDEVRASSHEDFIPEGAIIAMDCLSGRKLADIIPNLNEGVAPLTPSRRLFITQPRLEVILGEHFQKAGGTLLRGHELEDLEQNADSVTATVRNLETSARTALKGRYLIGADGVHSRVRELLGIPFEGRGVFSNSMTVYFRADVSPCLLGKPLSVIYINNPVFGGFMRVARDCQSGFVGVNTVGDPKANPVAAADAAADTSEKRLIEIVRAAAGVNDLQVEITGVARWRASTGVARSFRKDRVFLAGDAAHVMPPNGGFGGNTGIHDAHNLAWKLAFVLAGTAGETLLDSYEGERRPFCSFTVEQAYTRYVTRTAPYLGRTDFEPLAPDLNIELGAVYDSAAPGHGDPFTLAGRPGTRAPHIWIQQDGRRASTLDLFGQSFVLLAARSGKTWIEIAQRLKVRVLKPLLIGEDLLDPDQLFEKAYDLSPTGAALVRPDGVVAWRAKERTESAEGDLGWAIAQILNPGTA